MENLNNSIIINSSVELDRNIKNLCFTDKMKVDLAQVNANNLSSVITPEFEKENFSKINLWEHEYNYVKEFVDRNIITKELLARKDKSAFFYNDSAVIMINGKNHIEIKSTASGLELEKEYKIVDGYIKPIFNACTASGRGCAALILPEFPGNITIRLA